MTVKTRFRTFPRLVLRQAGLLALSVILGAVLLSLALPVRAQDGDERQLSVGDVVTGTLDSDDFVQTYTFFANTGDSISLSLTTETEALAPMVFVSAPTGVIVAQDTDLTSPTTVSIPEISIPTNGTYTIMVMRGSGAEGEASGEFELELTGVRQVSEQTVTIEDGLLFDLAWAEAVNLNLEVRDPVGGTVHAFNTSAPSGGTLDADVNGNCDAAISDNPTETIAWPAGDVPAGSYEIIIYYVDACDVGGPQVFDLSASANGTPQSLSGTLNPGQRYLARLELGSDGAWTLVNGGVNAGLDTTLFRSEIANPDPIAVGTTVTGVITNDAPGQAYSFDATAGTTVRIDLMAQSGSLDTNLVLLAPDNTPLVNNDDASEDTTNSAIERNLAVDGTYIILATRYGLTIGGTEGEYTLELSTVEVAGTPAPDATGTGTGVTTPLPEGTEDGAALPQGSIEVLLQWNTNADLQLQVRDPSGVTVYDDRPTIQSGGTLDEDGNRECIDTTTTPVSYIYWPPNRLVPGTYEVEIWFQQNCDDTAPVNFSLTVDVQGETVINTSQSPTLNSRYMITFDVGNDGTATAGPGGFFDMANANTLNYQSRLDTAIPITYGGTVSGSITDRQEFEIYSFEGEQGDIVTITLNATGGTLDTAVYLISPDGIQVDYGDDVIPGENTNSVIDEATLATDGTYYIIATHYGLNVGGTEGTYNLTLIQE
ncbi:MAG: hypothetical protein GXY36_11030 [Chloroflexi bacterium]|nr:hypothetical protein [Chloroflexota bacterium]